LKNGRICSRKESGAKLVFLKKSDKLLTFDRRINKLMFRQTSVFFLFFTIRHVALSHFYRWWCRCHTIIYRYGIYTCDCKAQFAKNAKCGYA